MIKTRETSDLFKMAGKQFIFKYDENNDNELLEFYRILNSRLEKLMTEYRINEEHILLIQIIFKSFSKR